LVLLRARTEVHPVCPDDGGVELIGHLLVDRNVAFQLVVTLAAEIEVVIVILSAVVSRRIYVVTSEGS
jgi:hypothetical protein